MKKGLEAFSAFKDNLRNETQYSNGDESFRGKVIYSWQGKTEHETLIINLLLTSFEYGTIRIEDGEIINIDNVHTQFTHKFQDYSYDSDGFLIIKGNSPRLGEYRVKIIEV